MAKMIIGTDLNEGSDKSSEKANLLRRLGSSMVSLPRTAASIGEVMLTGGL
jgi:hypothetical protein